MLTNADIEKYFSAEKSESMLYIIFGITAMILAFVFIFYFRTNLAKGAAVPLLVVGLIHFVIGTVIFKRSDKDRVRVIYAVSMNPGEIATKEIPRMELVNKNFVYYRYFEIAFILVGAGLLFFVRLQPGNRFWMGVGVALIVEAVVSLGADYPAEKRAGVYTLQLRNLRP